MPCTQATKETKASSHGVLAVTDGSQEIAKTAEATTLVPLIAAPMLPEPMLDRLKMVRITRQNTRGDKIKEQYTVIGYTWRSDISMSVHTSRGDTLELHNGNADLLIDGTRYQVCSAEVSCSPGGGN